MGTPYPQVLERDLEEQPGLCKHGGGRAGDRLRNGSTPSDVGELSVNVYLIK